MTIFLIMLILLLVTNYLWFVAFTGYRNSVKEALDEHDCGAKIRNQTGDKS